MKIKKLSVLGLKVGDFSHQLSAVNVIQGSNFSGKTARLDSIRLGLLGYLPELGKTSVATSAICRNGAMSISMEMDNGTSVTRSWKTDKGTFKSVVSSSSIGDVPAVLIDPQEYFGLGDKDRVRYVFGLAKIDGSSDVSNLIKSNLKSIKVDGHNPQHEVAIGEAVETVNLIGAPSKTSWSTQEFVDHVIVKFKDDLKIVKQNCVRMAGTVQGMTVLQASDSDDASMANVSGMIDSIRKDQTKCAAEIRSVSDDVNRISKMEIERVNIAKAIALTPDAGETIAYLDMESKRLESDIEGYKSITPERAESLSAAQRAAALVEASRENLRTNRRLITDKFRIDAHADACPHCGASEDGWKLKIVERFTAEAATIDVAIVEIEARLLEAEREAVTAKANYLQCVADDKLFHDATLRYSEVSRMLRVHRDSKDTMIKLRTQLESVDKQLAEQSKSALGLKAEKLGTEHAILTQHISDLESKQKSWVQAKQDQARNAQAILALEAAEASKVVLAEAVKLIEALQAAMVDQAFGPIMGLANAVTRGILRSKLEFKDGEIGRWEGSTWVSHKAFSGTEKALAYAGIAVALATQSPIKIVLIDELGRVDKDNKVKLIDRMIELTNSGVIDQFVGVDAGFSDVPQPINIIWV